MIIANAFPKSGTGLLRQILTPFGPDQGHIGMYDGQTGKKCSSGVMCETLEDTKAWDGFCTAHLHWNLRVSSILHDTKVLFLVRDPRDVIVSHAHYIYTTEEHHLHEHYMERKFDQSPIMTSMVGIPDLEGEEFPDIANRFLPYMGWMYHAYVIFFEDLIQIPERTIKALAAHLGDESKATLMMDAIDPENSVTFRKGRVGGWQDEFSNAEKEYYDKHFYWLNGEMGYYSKRFLSREMWYGKGGI